MEWVPGEAHRALRLVWGSGRGGSVNHAKAPAVVRNEAPLNSPRGRSVQLARWPERSTGVQQPEPTPPAGRVSNGRGTNVKPRPPDWTEDEGLKHSVASARAACGEQSRIRSGSLPSWATVGKSESSLGSSPGNRDHAPRFLWRETLEKPDNATIITGLKPGWYPLRGVNRPDRSIEFIETSTKVHKTRPAICRASRAPTTSTTAPTSPSV